MKLLDIQKGDSILDVGCGQGFYSDLITRRGGTVYGVDISQNMIKEYTRKGFAGKVIDIVKTPIKEKYDKVLCAGALEFTSDPNKALENISNSLKFNSLFILLFPRLTFAGIAYKAYHLTHGIRITLFSDKLILRLLEQNNMETLQFERATCFTGVIKARLL